LTGRKEQHGQHEPKPGGFVEDLHERTPFVEQNGVFCSTD
jgi:hypothetical protein